MAKEKALPFFHQHLKGAAPLDLLGGRIASKANSAEWEAFRRTFPPYGVPVDDERATKMAVGLESLVTSVMNDRFAKFRYSVSHGLSHNGPSSVAPPDAVMHYWNKECIRSTEDPDEVSELIWDHVLVLFDFSPHVRGMPSGGSQRSVAIEESNPEVTEAPVEIESKDKTGTGIEENKLTAQRPKLTASVDDKHLAWAKAVREKASRAIVIGFAFNGNEYHQWAVKEDGVLLKSPNRSLPGVTGAPLVRNASAHAEGLSQFLFALDTLTLSEVAVAAPGDEPGSSTY